ncbi:MAG: hypothetical protein PHR35_12045 [Kiritimatiellae bacterium]|nr:hypothetical protein [Kiritimatiellia bacterium]
MKTNEVTRQKFLQLMEQIEELEDRIAATEKLSPSDAGRANLGRMQEELARQRVELQRVSDGCGVPHGQNL